MSCSLGFLHLPVILNMQVMLTIPVFLLTDPYWSPYSWVCLPPHRECSPPRSPGASSLSVVRLNTHPRSHDVTLAMPDVPFLLLFSQVFPVSLTDACPNWGHCPVYPSNMSFPFLLLEPSPTSVGTWMIPPGRRLPRWALAGLDLRPKLDNSLWSSQSFPPLPDSPPLCSLSMSMYQVLVNQPLYHVVQTDFKKITSSLVEFTNEWMRQTRERPLGLQV